MGKNNATFCTKTRRRSSVEDCTQQKTQNCAAKSAAQRKGNITLKSRNARNNACNFAKHVFHTPKDVFGVQQINKITARRLKKDGAFCTQKVEISKSLGICAIIRCFCSVSDEFSRQTSL